MNVLSLFDGLSGAQLALTEAGIKVDNYYASEVDKYAIAMSTHNYPNTKHLGDVTQIDNQTLQSLGHIDLLIGGSPCQGFSMAGKMKGSSTKSGVDVVTLQQYLDLKTKGFEFDGQSYLFWEYIRILETIKPTYFLLENVRITKKWLPMFNEATGVEPIAINSKLLTAQSRPRFYWTNIPNVKVPEDKGIMLQHILDTRYFVGEDVKDTERNRRHYREDDQKSLCCTASMYKGAGNNGMTLVKNIDREDILLNSSLNRSGTDTYLGLKQKIHKSIQPSTAELIDQQHRTIEAATSDIINLECTSGFSDHKVGLKKTPCLRAGNSSTYIMDKSKTGVLYRKITVNEAEKLQGVPVDYTKVPWKKGVMSNTQRLKAIGNGFTIPVIAHIIKDIQ